MFEFHAAILPPRRLDAFLDAVRQAQAQGFDRFWIADQGLGADPFVLLQAAADRVEIPLGLAVTSPLARHPVQIARSIATLVQLHPQRQWIFALGLANPHHVLGPLGVQARRPAHHLAEALRVIRSLLSGARVTSDQPELSFRCADAALDVDVPAPVVLFVGTRGPRVLRDAAGREADGVIVEALFTPDGVTWARDALDRGSVAAGRGRFDRPHVCWQMVEVRERQAPLAEQARSFAALLLRASGDELLAHLGVDAGLARAVKAGTVPAEGIPPDVLERFVASGPPQELVDAILSARRAGATAWSSLFVGDIQRAREMMTRFADGVMTPARARIEAERVRK